MGLALDFGLRRTPTGLAQPLRWVLSAALLAAAVALIAGALSGFRRANTAVEPWVPTTALVTTGVYAWSRNPIYAGIALAFAALALVFDSLVALLLLPPLLALVQWGVILREERYLLDKFGADYQQYCQRVRR